MESCSAFELLLSRALDEALSAEEDRRLHTHLTGCAACQKLSQELSALQTTFASLSADPPSTLHAQLLEALAQENTPITSPSSGKAVSPRSHRRYATTAAAFLLLVSGVVFGARFLPSTSPEDMPFPDNTVLSDPDVPARAAMEATPEDSPDSATPNAKTAGQVAPQPAQGLPADSSRVAPSSAPSDTQPSAMENAVTDQPNVSMAIGLMSAPLTQEEAEAKLLAQLMEAGDTAPQLSFLRLSEDGSAYLFLYMRAQGTDLFYSVSLQGGSICLASTEESASITDN